MPGKIVDEACVEGILEETALVCAPIGNCLIILTPGAVSILPVAGESTVSHEYTIPAEGIARGSDLHD